eukprot:GFUD01016364.1.p1 GENE.GFUD01016364.1~~GFUD01016364.1.p1  ORF type:complete len:1852 (-),score=400.17 GFUD01016364.1:67-5622(-)
MSTSKVRGTSNGGSNANSTKPRENLIPDIEDISQIDSSSVEFFKPIVEAENLALQVDGIRDLMKNISKDKFQISAIVLVQWYFNCGLKSGIRKVISNCLNTIKDEDFASLVIEQISVHIRKACDEEEGTSVDTVKRILLLFDNFKYGESGILAESGTVLKFLMNQLEDQIENVCEGDISPVDKASQTEEAGESIRALVYLVKGNLGKLDLGDAISSLVYRILCQGDLPLDLRSNCGIIYVLIEKSKDVDKIYRYVEEISKSSSTADSIFSASNPGSILSLMHGIMSTFSKEEVAEAQKNRGILGHVLLCYLSIASQDKETQSVLGHNRGLLNWSSKFLDYCKANNCAAFVTNSQKDLFQYIWNHLEHPVDSVKHNTKSFVNNLIQGLVAGNADDQIDQLLADTIALPLHKKARLVALSCMVKSYNIQRVVEVYPNIQSDILSLSSEYALVGQIVDVYDNLLGALFKNCSDSNSWFESSVKPLIELYNSQGTQGVTQLVTNLLKRAVKLDPQVIDLILADGKSSNKLALCCLKMGREIAQEWNFAKHKALITASFEDFSDEIRLQAFGLCIESHSTVEAFSQPELELLYSFISSHLILQSPSAQQVFTVLVKKMLKRIYEGAAAMCKKLTQKKFEKEFETIETTLAFYNSSLQELVITMFGNLFPCANFPRRSTVLEILCCVNTIIGFKTTTQRIDLSGTITQATANSLLNCLHDSYDNNKEKALSILKSIPPHVLNFHSPDHVSDHLTECFNLMSSSKPPDCITASYFLKLLLTAPALPWVLADRLSLITSKPETVKFMLAVNIRNSLVEQLATAETSLLDAAADGPMYGTIAALKSVYEELKPDEFSEEWEHLTKDIISVCYNVWRVVSSVVASDSPEGHLPMDQDQEGRQRLQRVMKQSLGNKSVVADKKRDDSFDLYCAVFNQVVVSDVFPDEIAEEIVDELVDDILGQTKETPQADKAETELKVLERQLSEVVIADETLLSPEEDISESSESGLTKAREVSSQMLLLCAWRSVKEISLFLGDLCKTFTGSGVNIVTSEQILDIASFLMDLLSETKHRGAFEQAYVAFSKLCSCLWQSSHSELHSHPHQLLDEVLYSISEGKKGSKSNLCATRRSAGVPFIVQAVVSTEIDSAGSTFKNTMEKLLKLAGDNTADAESRVHSLNILRALYRDSKLGDLVSTFVEEGVKVAIVGFKASDWAERNAATLLFSALMTRIFGVKREKDTVSNKNCLTGKVFFQRYPTLHQFFLGQFEENPSAPKDRGVLVLDSALYPILLVLSRIFPSPTELLNNPYQLSAFLPFVETCTRSSVLQTRRLAASALIPLVQYEEVDLYVADLIKKICGEKLSQNALHGMLLQLKEFLKKFGDLEGLLADILLTNPLVDKLVKDNACSLTSAAFITLVNMVLDKSSNSECISYLQSILVEKLFDEKESSNADTALTLPSDVWKPLFFRRAARLIVKSSFAKEEISFAVKLLVHPEYEVRQEVIELVRDHLSAGLKPDIPCQELMSLLFCEKHPACLEKLLDCCSKLSKEHLLGDQIPFLLSLIESTDNDDIKAAGISLCSKMLSSSDPTSRLSWALMIKDSLECQNNLVVREAAAKAIVDNSSFLVEVPKSDQFVERKACVLLWFSCLKLLLDDESSLRDQVSILNEKLSGSKINPTLAGEKLVDLMLNKIGKSWPAAGVAACICSVLSLLFEHGDFTETSSEVDKAFDKNEMNNYQELLSLAMLVLPPLGRLVRKLSPKMQEKAFNVDLPEDLVSTMLPELPGAVTVYNIKQLLEYMAARACGETGEMEGLVMVMMFNSLRCKISEETFLRFQTIQGEKFSKMKNKSFFVESIEQLGATGLKQG